MSLQISGIQELGRLPGEYPAFPDCGQHHDPPLLFLVQGDRLPSHEPRVTDSLPSYRVTIAQACRRSASASGWLELGLPPALHPGAPGLCRALGPRDSIPAGDELVEVRTRPHLAPASLRTCPSPYAQPARYVRRDHQPGRPARWRGPLPGDAREPALVSDAGSSWRPALHALTALPAGERLRRPPWRETPRAARGQARWLPP